MLMRLEEPGWPLPAGGGVACFEYMSSSASIFAFSSPGAEGISEGGEDAVPGVDGAAVLTGFVPLPRPIAINGLFIVVLPDPVPNDLFDGQTGGLLAVGDAGESSAGGNVPGRG